MPIDRAGMLNRSSDLPQYESINEFVYFDSDVEFKGGWGK